jgi:hypothetical protein
VVDADIDSLQSYVSCSRYLVPESFRGGCSFGGPSVDLDLSPVLQVMARLPKATVTSNRCRFKQFADIII